MTEWIVSSAVLIVVVTLVRQLLKGKISLRLQYALWAIVLVRLLVPVTFGESKISVLNVLEQAAAVVERQETEVPTQNAPENPMSTTPVGGELETPGITIDIPPQKWGNDDWKPQTAPTITQAPNGTFSEDWDSWEQEQDAAWEEYKEEHTRHVTVTAPQILTLLWLCGIAVVGFWFLFTNLRFRLRLRRSRRVSELDCPIRVYVTGAAETPCLFGLFRPAIYLTPEVAEDEAALRHVLAHELTHYHHWDHIWAVLRCVCLAVHWYNPLVWLAASLSRRDAELACDESTIRRIGEEERTAYGRTLIGLTCVHRSNLLHTATTMTGSKKGIKERIVLIAKKPKMTIYTLVAVILIAAIAVGCTFTGAKRKGGLSHLAQLEADSIDLVVLGHAPYSCKLPEEQYGELVDLLHRTAEQPVLKEMTVTEAEDYPDGVEYAMTVIFDGETCIVNCIPDEDGGAELFCYSFGPTTEVGEYSLCWIEFDELYQFIKQTIDAHMEEELPSDTPQAVLDCAEQVLADQLTKHIQENGKGERTELIGLKQHETGTAGLNDAVFIYRITYNLHWDNAFEYHQHYMALGYDYVTEEYIRLDDFSADELITRYGTEELLAKYDGEMFVAAAMELYQEWLKEEPWRQTVVFEAEILEISESKRLLTVWAYGKECAVEITKGLEIYGIDGVAITAEELAPGQIIEVTSANQVIYEPVETYGSCYVIRVIQDVGSANPADALRLMGSELGITLFERIWMQTHTLRLDTNCNDSHHFAELLQLLSAQSWVEVEKESAPSDFRTTFVSLDHTKSLTIYSGSDGQVDYTCGGVTTRWRPVEKIAGADSDYALKAKEVYQQLEYHPNQVVQADDPLTAAKAFVESYGAERLSWSPGHVQKIADYRLLKWGLDEVSTDATAAVGWIEFAMLPDGNYDNFMAGGIVEGTGEYEGWVIDRKGFMLVRKDDLWSCFEWGGGMGEGTLEHYGYTPMEEWEIENLRAERESALCQVDGSETDYDVIAQSLAEQYAQCILNRSGWVWGQVLDVQVKSTEVFDAYYGADDPNFCFEKLLYIKVNEEQRNYWETGSGLDPVTEGPYAGWYVHGLEVSARKLEDGNWHMTGMGTGGAWVDLPVSLDQAAAKQLAELYFLTEGFTHDWRILYRLGETPVEEVRECLNELDEQQRQELTEALRDHVTAYPDYAVWKAEDL